MARLNSASAASQSLGEPHCTEVEFLVEDILDEDGTMLQGWEASVQQEIVICL